MRIRSPHFQIFHPSSHIFQHFPSPPIPQVTTPQAPLPSHTNMGTRASTSEARGRPHLRLALSRASPLGRAFLISRKVGSFPQGLRAWAHQKIKYILPEPSDQGGPSRYKPLQAVTSRYKPFIKLNSFAGAAGAIFFSLFQTL